MKLKKDGKVSKQGEGGGKPPKFSNEKDLQESLTKYAGHCDTKKEMPNKAGLCLFLCMDRSTYNDYKKKYPHTIKGIENLIENTWIQRLSGNSPTGAIFYLKNAFKEFYKDRQETDITSGGEKIAGINYIIPNGDNNKTNT